MKGSTLLKVISILLIIFSIISLLFLLFSGVIASFGVLLGSAGSWALLGLLVFPSLSVVLELVTGIVGVMNSNKPQKAQSCIMLGIVLLVIVALGSISTFTRAFDFSDVISVVVGFLLPVLYLVGAVQLKNAGK